MQGFRWFTMKNKRKIILDLCGGTGSWSKPYKDAGYKVFNITLPEFDITETEFYKAGFIFKWNSPSGIKLPLVVLYSQVYGILAAPPCTMFSFCRTNAKKPRDLKGAMEIVHACMKIIWECQSRVKKDTSKVSPLKFWALENPNGFLKYFLGKPALQFSPYEFGDEYKKRTHLWGWFNFPTTKRKIEKCNKPKFDKMASKDIHPEFYGKLTRQERRAITPAGFASAFFEANR